MSLLVKTLEELTHGQQSMYWRMAVIFPDERRAEWKHLIIDARFLIDFDTFFEIVEGALEDSTDI